MAITIDGLTVPLPKNWAEVQMKQAFEESVVGKLSASTPMPLGETVVPVYEGGFEVGYVAEANPKPVSDVSLTHRVLAPQKFAGIVLVSQEAARLNPAAMLENIQADMRNGVSRQIDYGVFYGKSARTGAAIPNVSFVNQTTSRATAAGTVATLDDELLALYDATIAANANGDPDGWAFDSSYRTRVARLSQSQNTVGATIPALPNLGVGEVGTLAGLRAAYGRTVSGRVGTQAATNTVGFLGDWTRGLKWGFGSSIEMKRSDQATIVDGQGKQWNLFQDNMIAYLIEFVAGWSVDPTQFGALDKAGA